MTTIYLAGRYTRLDELQGPKADLEALGHEVTSRWLLGEHQWDGQAVEFARAYEAGLNPPEAVGFALDDVEDLVRARIVISFTEPPRPDVLTADLVVEALDGISADVAHGWTVYRDETEALAIGLNKRAAKISRGGRHVEFGMALAMDKRLVVVGPRENVFHLLPAVEQFDTWPLALAALAGVPA